MKSRELERLSVCSFDRDNHPCRSRRVGGGAESGSGALTPFDRHLAPHDRSTVGFETGARRRKRQGESPLELGLCDRNQVTYHSNSPLYLERLGLRGHERQDAHRQETTGNDHLDEGKT